MLKNMMGSPIAWGILSLIAVFSLLFAIYTWIVGKKKKQVSIVCETNEVIASGKSKIEKLYIQYDGEEIDNLSVTKFYIWNSGNEVINNTDIVGRRPLSIICSEPDSILDIQIIKANEETNAFSIAEIKNQRVSFDFDYIEPGDGFVVQILHTGKAIDLDLDCKIKGGKEIRDVSYNKRKRKETKGESIITLFMTCLPVALGLICFHVSILFCMEISQIDAIPQIIAVPITLLLMIGGMILGGVIGILIQNAINKKFYRTIPQSLLE